MCIGSSIMQLSLPLMQLRCTSLITTALRTLPLTQPMSRAFIRLVELLPSPKRPALQATSIVRGACISTQLTIGLSYIGHRRSTRSQSTQYKRSQGYSSPRRACYYQRYYQHYYQCHTTSSLQQMYLTLYRPSLTSTAFCLSRSLPRQMRCTPYQSSL